MKLEGGRWQVVIVSELYTSLTDFIPMLKNITYGKWYPEKQTGDGSAEHPFQMPFVSYDNVAQMDGQCVMALLLRAIRAERFCDGALLGFFEKGCVGRWLDRLKEIDESGVKGVYEDP